MPSLGFSYEVHTSVGSVGCAHLWIITRLTFAMPSVLTQTHNFYTHNSTAEITLLAREMRRNENRATQTQCKLSMLLRIRQRHKSKTTKYTTRNKKHVELHNQLTSRLIFKTCRQCRFFSVACKREHTLETIAPLHSHTHEKRTRKNSHPNEALGTTS